MRIAISKLKRIREHAKRVYPEECCGLLIGTSSITEGGARENTVYAIVECINQLDGDRTQGFEIAITDVWRAEMLAREIGMEIVGNYHSHTNAGAYPSVEDERQCRVFQTMLIVSLENGIIEETRAWNVGTLSRAKEEVIAFI